jgi:hypothetical protein
LKEFQENLEGRSRRSLFRDFSKVDYISSYSHGGQFYTLKLTPKFDSYGLWHYRDIGFSKHGNLKKTLIHFIESSQAGMKHGELNDRLRISVFNTLLNLVVARKIKRTQLGRSYLYVSANKEHSKVSGYLPTWSPFLI